MEKSQVESDSLYDWPGQSSYSKKQNKSFLQKSKPKTKHSQESVIRDLQSVFCKGRFRSWVFAQN